MKLSDLRKEIISRLPDKDGAAYEADAIISHVYGLDKTQILSHLFDEIGDAETVYGILARRTLGEPLEYIIGKTVFFGLDLIVTPDCLIPQADTEVVVKCALDRLVSGSRFLDVGTGSGCIAVALAKNSGCSGVAVDISEKALEAAKQNAAINGVREKIRFALCDIFGELDINEKFDLVVSNPPYVRTRDIESLSPEVRREPITALDGGEDGLMFYRRIAAISPSVLKPGGTLVLEIGYDEAEDVCAILCEYGFECSVTRDFGGNDRCVTAFAKKK